MQREWPQDAVEFGRTVRSVLADLGGVELARDAERDPQIRQDVLAGRLAEIGLREVDPLGDPDEAAAALLGVRAAGSVVAPWPLVHELAVPVEERGNVDGAYLVRGVPERLDHADRFDRPVLLPFGGGDGAVRVGRSSGPVRGAPLDPFGAPAVDTGETLSGEGWERAAATHVVLDAAWISGALSTVLQQTARYAGERRQFGRAVGEFGEIRWRLADMAVAQDGIDELTDWTWWRLQHGAASDADVLALRLAALEAAATVLANGHQVLGAVGLCEEHDVAVIDRHLQSVLRRPGGQATTTGLLMDAIDREGFDGIFPVPSRTSAVGSS